METVICGHEVLRDVSQLAPASLARRLARVQTWPVSPIPTYGAFIPAYSNVDTFKSKRLYTYTHPSTDTSRSISRHRVTDGSCTHLPSFPRKWSQVDPPPPPETPLMTKLANFDQLGFYLPPPFPLSVAFTLTPPLLSLSLPLSSLANSHSLSNARRIYLDR